MTKSKLHEIEFATGIIMTMTWVIKTDADDVELPGEKYDPKGDYSPKYSLKNTEIQEWLDNNVTGKVYINMKGLFFEVAEDAMAFKLRWL